MTTDRRASQMTELEPGVEPATAPRPSPHAFWPSDKFLEHLERRLARAPPELRDVIRAEAIASEERALARLDRSAAEARGDTEAPRSPQIWKARGWTTR